MLAEIVIDVRISASEIHSLNPANKYINMATDAITYPTQVEQEGANLALGDKVKVLEQDITGTITGGETDDWLVTYDQQVSENGPGYAYYSDAELKMIIITDSES